MADSYIQSACSSAGKTPLLPRWLVSLLMVLLILFVYDDARSASEGTAARPDESATVGITEHLGSKIPLDVTFRDETGTPVRLADLITGPTIILPVYFSCANICYNLQWGLARVLPTLKSKPGEEYRVISISFDENDSPQLAAKFKRVYLSAMHAPFPESGWRFLTGDAASIKRFTDIVGFSFQRRGHDFLHPVASIVVSGDGTIVRYLYGSTFLSKDLALALVEARHGTGGTAVRKVMEYCFSYDPGKNTYVFNLLRVSATAVILCAGGFLVFLIVTGRKRKQGSSRK